MSKSHAGRRGLAALATSALVVGACVAGAGAASADSNFKFDRVAGQNRYETSIAAAKVYGNSANVILASGENGHYPDALTANYLAGVNGAPVLLTRQAKTPQDVLDYLKSSGVKTITIVGDTNAVSAQQEADLKAAGYTVNRLGGHNRYDTAKAVITSVGGSHPTGILATGEHFPDALGGGPLSYAKNFPLAITRPNALPQSTLDSLQAAGVKQVIVLGGTTAVSQAVVDQLNKNGITVLYRADGANRTDTSVKLAEYELKNYNFSNTRVNVASGEEKLGGVDALSGGPVSGKEVRPLLITRSISVPGNELIAYLKAHAATLTGTDNHIFGGPLAVSPANEAAMEAAAQTAAAPASATALPELVSAKLGNTVTSTAATANNPAGTRVTYTFDEAVTGANPTASDFKVYDYADGSTTGNTATVSTDGRSVTVIFTGLDTDAEAANLTLATVVPGAVTDGDNNTNPQGDAPIGTARTITGGAAGVTAAPDLVSVGNFRDALTPGDALVDFTFDEKADAQTLSGYHLVLKDGSDLEGTGPVLSSTNPSGQNVPGGNGTTTFTVEFTRQAGQTLDQLKAATSRGTIDAGTVADVDTASVVNPLESADVNNSGNTDTPDLVSAQLQPGATAADDDKVLYTFDEPVQVNPTAADFGVYDASGAEDYSGTVATRNPSNSSQVLVDFGAGATAVDTAVGANVLDGAVVASTGAATAANQQDEVGVSNPTSTTVTPGQTAAPDLTGVALSRGTDAFGNPTAYRATFTFDEKIDSLGTGTAYLYLADGTAIPLSGGQILQDANGKNTNQVRYTATSGNSTIYGSSVLGTVEQNVVKDADGLSNPEGAEFTTGGTGTPAS